MLNASELLPPGAREALARAVGQRLSYTARYVVAPGPRPRVVVILGEAHVKLGLAAELGQAVVACFELRGVETFQRDDVALGRLLGWLIHAPRVALRVLSFGLVKGSTIVDAKAMSTGHTAELERGHPVPLSLHVASLYLTALFASLYFTVALTAFGISPPLPLIFLSIAFEIHMFALLPALLVRHQPWAWWLHPALALVTARDRLMADGTVRMMLEQTEPSAALVIMGRAHVPGFERELIERHGFQRAGL